MHCGAAGWVSYQLLVGSEQLAVNVRSCYLLAND